ncbi:M57 family metalloprotease [Paraflavisolibacter sp. H34]|uniref:M57 family metalloprotease n=1 Tax=Huijunlia imazamoxiresistens TaxID=3127457 RepID=UPI0030187C83
MKKMFLSLTLIAAVTLVFTACKKDADTTQASAPQQNQEISPETLSQIKQLGFGTSSVKKLDKDHYLVENDIVLTREQLNSKPKAEFIRVGDEEQYRTTNTVLGLPRTVTIRVSTALPWAFFVAADSAIRRYNSLGLLLRFARVTVGGEIVINPAPSGSPYLASAGFPNDYGNPYSQVLVNTSYLNSWPLQTKTSVLAHELGHCIGFRHTDYANRAYSCGGTAVNEGATTFGAKWIPGTPVGADPNSWMLACIGYGVNRPFNANDRIALNWLY